jgi:hypothetical protein
MSVTFKLFVMINLCPDSKKNVSSTGLVVVDRDNCGGNTDRGLERRKQSVWFHCWSAFGNPQLQ